MAEVVFSSKEAQNLKGKVVVITGGAQGIGAATVALLYNHGSHVFFGDWDDVKGRDVEQTLEATANENGGSAHFQKLDVRDYQSQLALFDAAWKSHGHIDVAISCAAVKEPPGWFEPQDLDQITVRKEPVAIRDHININLTSVIAFCRIALAFMNDPQSRGASNNCSKSIILVSSIAGITEAPGLFSYSSAKHGIIGLMRALRPWAPLKYGVRANAICPWATDTQLLGDVKSRWVEEKMPMNQPEDVGRMIIQCASDQNLNGKAIFVTGGRGFDTEEGIDKTQPQWMGEENSSQFLKGQAILGLGDKWTSSKL